MFIAFFAAIAAFLGIRKERPMPGIKESATPWPLIFSHIQIPAPRVEFHLHAGYEIYFLISGDVNYFVEKQIYPLQYGDIVFTNNREIHRPSFKSEKLYERVCLEFNPAMIRPFCTPDLDLLGCFTNRENGEKNKISLTPHPTEEVMGLFRRMEHLTGDDRQGSDVLRLGCVLELLVLLNRLFLNIDVIPERTQLPEKLVPVLEYIDTHLDGDLSLDALEKNFFLNRFYLSKLFKGSTGSNLHNYILYKRIAAAKQLLADGASVSQACVQTGFNDYSNFLKQFKRTVGVTPGKYRRQET
jgi:AraC-like DNA-binding protein